MEHEDLLDASVEVLAGNTQPEESAASLTKRLMNKLNFSSNRVTETVLETQNCNAIAFMCQAEKDWERIGYIVSEALKDTNEAISSSKILGKYFS